MMSGRSDVWVAWMEHLKSIRNIAIQRKGDDDNALKLNL